MLTEELPLNDVTIRVVNKVLADNSAITDLYASHFTKGTIAETVTILETFANVITFNRHINDAFTLDDAALIDKDYYGNKGNVATLLEVIGLSYIKPLTGDTCTVGDAVDVVMTYIQTLNESLLATDIHSIASNINKVETLTITELYAPQFNANKTETSTLSDSNYFEFLKNIYDTLLLIDSESNPLGTFVLNSRVINTSSSAFNIEKGNDQADSFAVSDSTDVSAGKQFTDPLSTSPSAFSDVDIFNLLKGVNENLNLAEIITLVSTFPKSDTMTLSELAGKELSKIFSDGFAIDDATVVDKNYYGNKGNVANLNDIVTLLNIFSRQFTDTATITEDLDNHLSKILQGSGEIVNINDTIDVKRITGGVMNMIPLNRVGLN
jgi:hypothetical protein